MAEEGVIVEQDAAVNLTHYLTEIGRIRNKTAREVGAAIQSGVNARWGTAKVPQFRDSNGIGWVVEISERFDGEVLYAIVRPGEEGRRHVTEVVGEDQLRKMFPTKKGDEQAKQQPQQAPSNGKQQRTKPVGPDPIATLTQEVAAMRAKNEDQAKQIETLEIRCRRLAAGDPEGPALVRWKVAVKEENGQSFSNEEQQIKVGEVGEKVQALINIGIKAEHIEVWSRRQQPRVRVELE